jgi:hypothetical protein
MSKINSNTKKYDNPTFLEVSELLSKGETTEELKKYWASKFYDILNSKKFEINAQTISILSRQDTIFKPITPMGGINLIQHIRKGEKDINESDFQTTVEISIRMLDSLIEIINFHPEAKRIVSEYRKIGIGINDIDEYLLGLNNLQRVERINYLGNLFSNSAYRSSESLAEEKGVCESWEEIKQYIKPKPFEYWYNIETGEIRSGTEISQDFSKSQIVESKFEIVPRRNSHILILPSTDDWKTWSDREIPYIDKNKEKNNATIQKNKTDSTNLTNKVLNNKTAVKPELVEIESIVPNIEKSFDEKVDNEIAVPKQNQTKPIDETIPSLTYTEEKKPETVSSNLLRMQIKLENDLIFNNNSFGVLKLYIKDNKYDKLVIEDTNLNDTEFKNIEMYIKLLNLVLQTNQNTNLVTNLFASYDENNPNSVMNVFFINITNLIKTANKLIETLVK